MKRYFPAIWLLSIICAIFLSSSVAAQGTWTALTDFAPDLNAGVMILLSDGSVICKTSSGDTSGIGNVWNKLTPDIHGSYINGTWSTIAPMHDTRLYFSSQLLKDGRLYVAGGEYGTGGGSGEVYDPLANTWTATGPLPFSDSIWDGNSEMLPDGRVLQGIVSNGGYDNEIYNPQTNAYTSTGSCLGSHDESSWVKLADSSILFVDWGSSFSERYIPSTGTWVADGIVPVSLYDNSIYETGPALLLPNGHAIFFGGGGQTAYYTPSGNTSPGTWAAGPVIPNAKGAPDAAAAMMVNGKILIAVSDTPTWSVQFPSPTSFYVFDYLLNSFTAITAPTGDDTLDGPCYYTNMLNLPDGSILFGEQGSPRYYTYMPAGSPLAAGKPTIDSVFKINCDTFKITGTLFNGISEGSNYGDDWQMNTNYPLVRLTLGTNVYYTRTWNWNRTGVMTGAAKDTAFFRLPAALPTGTYSLEVVVNGNPSIAHTFKTCGVGVETISPAPLQVTSVYPNPTGHEATVSFTARSGSYSIELTDLLGRTVLKETGEAVTGNNKHTIHVDGLPGSVYTVIIRQNDGSVKTKLLVN